MKKIINLKKKFNKFHDCWSPKIIAGFNNQEIKLVKIKGNFISHKHDETDEVFIATSAGGITPIVKVDDRIYSNGQIGEITKRIATTYLEWISEPKFRTEIDYSLAINTQ